MRSLVTGSAESPGAATIVNAMAMGRGAAFAIGLKVKAKVELSDTQTVRGLIPDDPNEDTALMEGCVRKVLERCGCEYGAVVETRSDLPVARGLSSSSACSNACVLATSAALEELGHPRLAEMELINIGIEASIDSGVTVTGAFDDASASFFGGATVTDNTRRQILRRMPMPSLDATVLVPEAKAYSGRVDLDKIRLLAPQVQIAHQEAVEGDLLKAMTLNGIIYCASLGYDPEPAILALGAGALAAGLSGKGPAFVALSEDGDRVVEAWEDLEGRIMRTRTDNFGSRVLE